jgi:hypothetical protein
MKKLFYSFALLLLSSCGYDSYNSCVKEEIQENNGQENRYILSYCQDKFPDEFPSAPTKEKWDNLSFHMDHESEVESDQLTLNNLSSNENIRMFAIGGYDKVSGSCPVDKPNLEYDYYNAYLKPGQSGTFKIIIRNDCLWLVAKGDKDSFFSFLSFN